MFGWNTLHETWRFCLCVCIYPTPPHKQDVTQDKFSKSLTGFLSLRQVVIPRLKKPIKPYCLLIAGGRVVGILPFPRVSALCKMLTAMSRIRTLITMSISYDNNHYTTNTSILAVLKLFFFLSIIHFCYFSCNTDSLETTLKLRLLFLVYVVVVVGGPQALLYCLTALSAPDSKDCNLIADHIWKEKGETICPHGKKLK